MIETKEQYEAWLKLIDPGEGSRQGHYGWMAHKTIEALRRFVRASDAVEIGVVDFDLHHEQVKELQDSRAALPAWIIQDG